MLRVFCLLCFYVDVQCFFLSVDVFSGGGSGAISCFIIFVFCLFIARLLCFCLGLRVIVVVVMFLSSCSMFVRWFQ